MTEYPTQYPCPLRAQFATDHDFLTRQTPTQSGYIIQRRVEPHIFKQVSLTYLMSVNELFAWWDWVRRYAYVWHLSPIQGVQREIRYISNVQFQYRNFATIEATVTAEETVQAEGEFWDEAVDGVPELYEPPVNDPYASDSTGGSSLDLDFKTSFLPAEHTLVGSSLDFTIGTSQVISAVSSVLVVSDANLTMELYDSTATVLIRSTGDGFFRWHHDDPADNSMFRLDPGTAYVLRITGSPGDVFKIWSYTR